MAYPSVTNTFVDGVAADAAQINNNNQDCINGITDGTKDLNVASATFNGAVAIAGTMTVSGTMLTSGRESGYRAQIGFGSSWELTTTQTGTFTTRFLGHKTIESAYVMPRSGCIRGLSYRIERFTAAAVGNATFTYAIRKNAANTIISGPWSLNASAVTTYVLSCARGSYEFNAGDKISFYVSSTVTPTSATFGSHILLEVQLY